MYYGNPQPSFLGVITQIFRAKNLTFSCVSFLVEAFCRLVVCVALQCYSRGFESLHKITKNFRYLKMEVLNLMFGYFVGGFPLHKPYIQLT